MTDHATLDANLLSARFAYASPYDVLHFALCQFGPRVRMACSFGVEDMVLLHEAARAGRDLGIRPRLFLLDTGRLPQQTYDLLEQTRTKYEVDIEPYAPDTIAVENLVRRAGPNGFYRSVEARLACCRVRKVLPLARALSGAQAWVTGQRREQSPERASVQIVEMDNLNGGLLKLNPLAAWSNAQVWDFVARNDVPTHALHREGYRSIGCAPCTRAILPGQDMRAGRWWWESDQHKECGLHQRDAKREKGVGS